MVKLKHSMFAPDGRQAFAAAIEKAREEALGVVPVDEIAPF
jgi:hypothetical protein